VCRTGPRWIVERLQDRQALAPLTGQDSRALASFLHLIALYGNSDGEGRSAAIFAMAHTLRAMQPSSRPLAKAAIPHVLDWDDEERLWSLVLLAASQNSEKGGTS
jgi:hypothetical protein